MYLSQNVWWWRIHALNLENLAFYKLGVAESHPSEGWEWQESGVGEKGHFALVFYYYSFGFFIMLCSLFLSLQSPCSFPMWTTTYRNMEKGIKDQTSKSKGMPHLLAQIPQMKGLIFRVKIFPGNTVQVWVSRCRFYTNLTYWQLFSLLLTLGGLRNIEVGIC